MAIGSATVQKLGGEAFASVTVEIEPFDSLQIKCDLTSPVQIETIDGEPLMPAGIEIACLSGARAGRLIFGVPNSRITIRSANGRIATLDWDAFGIATIVAMGNALKREHEIPETVFKGTFSSWACAA